MAYLACLNALVTKIIFYFVVLEPGDDLNGIVVEPAAGNHK